MYKIRLSTCPDFKTLYLKTVCCFSEGGWQDIYIIIVIVYIIMYIIYIISITPGSNESKSSSGPHNMSGPKRSRCTWFLKREQVILLYLCKLVSINFGEKKQLVLLPIFPGAYFSLIKSVRESLNIKFDNRQKGLQSESKYENPEGSVITWKICWFCWWIYWTYNSSSLKGIFNLFCQKINVTPGSTLMLAQRMCR